MKVLITAPSLDENDNVSGISTVVRQIIEHGQSEFVHFAAGSRDGNEGKLRWLARQVMLPLRFLHRIRSTSPDVVHINTAMTPRAVWRDRILVRCARFAGRPVVLSVHGGEFLRKPFGSSSLERLAEAMLRSAERVVVLSDEEREFAAKRWPGFEFDVLPNAVPVDLAEPRAGGDGPPIVIFLGRMHESKGLNEIIDACRQLKTNDADFVFRAYGDGPMLERFTAEMTDILGSVFEYGGVVSGTAKWKALAAADIFVLPSAFEGLSMALLEAMAAGCVIVASDIPAIRLIVRDGENGYLVEPGNSEMLAATLARLFADRRGWAAIRGNAVATIRDSFAIGEYLARLEQIYAAAAGPKR